MIPLNNLAFNDAEGIYRDDCTSEYEQDEGLEVIPVLGARDTPPVIVRLSSAYTIRRSKFNYSRSRVPPLVPPLGDTLSGHKYLGGTLAVATPVQDAYGNLTYRAGGMYTFVLPVDIRENGQIRFDAHGHRTKVDFLGHFNLGDNPAKDNTWNSPWFDLNILGSARILG